MSSQNVLWGRTHYDNVIYEHKLNITVSSVHRNMRTAILDFSLFCFHYIQDNEVRLFGF